MRLWRTTRRLVGWHRLLGLFRLDKESVAVSYLFELLLFVLAVIVRAQKSAKVVQYVEKRLSAELVLSFDVGARFIEALELGEIAPVCFSLLVLETSARSQFEFDVLDRRSVSDDLTNDLGVFSKDELTSSEETGIGRDGVRLEPVVGAEGVKSSQGSTVSSMARRISLAAMTQSLVVQMSPTGGSGLGLPGPGKGAGEAGRCANLCWEPAKRPMKMAARRSRATDRRTRKRSRGRSSSGLARGAKVLETCLLKRAQADWSAAASSGLRLEEEDDPRRGRRSTDDRNRDWPCSAKESSLDRRLDGQRRGKI